jgi:hypothetical protein
MNKEKTVKGHVSFYLYNIFIILKLDKNKFSIMILFLIPIFLIDSGKYWNKNK